MISIQDYEIKEKLQEGMRTIVYRGVRQSDQKPVVLKVLKSSYPSPREIEDLKREYHIAQDLDNEGLLRTYEMGRQDNRTFLVLEDFGGISLNALLKHDKYNIEKFLELALRLTRGLGALHRAGIIHKDIKPNNIIVSADGSQVKIGDFGISTRLSRENANSETVKRLEGTLAYISPEQTGRMNRSIDYRTDFYSLGATLFQTLTGRQVFTSEDALSMIHCHIALQPTSPSEINSTVPETISRIVLKLLAKNAEDRYQSTHGLIADLEKCLEQQRQNGRIENFEPGQQDFAERFQVPQQLYGRQNEIAALMNAFEKARAGAGEALMVSGYSGIGKSSLINEINKPIVESRGIFLAGKYDQFKRNIPYSALTGAFQRFLRGILAESEEAIEDWRAKILEALGPNAQVIIDVIPEVELITGAQPPAPALEAAEAQNRFSLVLRNFVNVFARAEHPLVLFIDDLQWADTPTLNFLKGLLLDPATAHLLLIGAYRDNEVDGSHPLVMTLGEIEKGGRQIGGIQLQNLAPEDLNQLVADTLRCTTDQSTPLSQLVASKTLGNPFFVNQFLNTLYSRGLVELDHERLAWKWDLARIQQTDITDNVVDLMTERMRTLNEEVQHLLRLASCAGNKFYLHSLAIIAEQDAAKTEEILQQALQEGLIYATGEIARSLLHEEDGSASAAPENQGYQFLHDRVQQAAYALIPEGEQQEVHLKIGRLLLKHSSAEEREENIFEIAGQLNNGAALIDDPTERMELARLNFQAGEKAKESTAYEPAIKHFRQSITLLGEDFWDKHYDFAFPLNRQLAESEYLRSNFEESDRLFLYILEHARENLQKADIQNLRIVQYVNTGRQPEGIAAGRLALPLLGTPVPDDEGTEAALGAELGAISENLGGRPVADLINAPEMTDEKVLMSLTLLVNVWISAYQIGNGNLATWCIARAMNLSLQHGNSPLTSFVYVLYGAIIASGMGQFEPGHDFGRLGVALVRKLNARPLMSRVFVIYACLVQCWREPLEDTIPLFKEAYQAGIDSGDILYAGFAALFIPKHPLINGDHVVETFDDGASFLPFLERQQDQAVLKVVRNCCNALLALQGQTNEPFGLSTAEVDEDEYVAELADPGNILWRCWYLNAKLQLLYFKGDYAAGLENIKAARGVDIRNILFGHFQVVEYFFYAALTAAAHHDQAEGEDRALCRTVLEEYLAAMRDWEEKCLPRLFRPRVAILEAELARLDGKEDTEALYDRALDISREEELINCEAVANLLTGRYYIAIDKPRIGRAFIADARYQFDRWGAFAVAYKLFQDYNQLLGFSQGRSGGMSLSGTTMATASIGSLGGSLSTRTGGPSSTSSTLDLRTFMDASRTLSEEIQLERLLDRLMEIVIQSAGATRGVLILDRENRLFIEAECRAENNQVEVLQSIPVEDSKDLPQSVIKVVHKTREMITGEEASADNSFQSDPYLSETAPQSYLCMPLIHQGKMKGVFYLENTIASGAFTGERLEMLELLSSQIAISLDNALLYSSLEQKVERRTLQLQEERDKADRLLLNILPARIADQLKEKNQVVPRQFESASIMFTDFRGFTSLTGDMQPTDLIRDLDALFSQFDEVIERNYLEKLKTIGDAYMCAGGLPEERPSHALDMCLAALSIVRFIREMNPIREAQGLPPWEIRVGISSGPLIAGVIGKHKFAYDVWGDTVNVASRMESTGEVGRINISATTHALIGDFFETEYRGKLDVKNKGQMDMYFLDRLKPEYSEDEAGSGPNARLKERREKLLLNPSPSS